MSQNLFNSFQQEFASPLAGNGLFLAMSATSREKLAEAAGEALEKKPANPWWTGLKTLGVGAAGMAAGGALGLGAAYLAEQAYKQKFHAPIPYGYIVPAAGLVGTAATLTGMEMRRRQAKAIQDAVESRQRS